MFWVEYNIYRDVYDVVDKDGYIVYSSYYEDLAQDYCDYLNEHF